MTSIAAPAASTSRRRSYRARWSRAVPETIYVLLGFAIATAWWVVLVTMLATGFGLAVTLIGIPLLALTAKIAMWMAQGERLRARKLLRLEVRAPYRATTEDTFLGRAWQRAKDPALWLDLVYFLVVFFPLALATFVIAVVWLGVGLALVAEPAYYWVGDGTTVANGVRIDTLPWALVATVAGTLLVAVYPYVIGALAYLHGASVRLLLGQRSSERVAELTQQRSTAVDAAVAERRRIERDLHDGAQQRLTALAIDLGRARVKLDADPAAARKLVEQAHEDAKLALTELRNLARGIHPAILTDRGLDAALSALTVRNPVPVDIDVELPERPSMTLESTAYFVVAEALANIAKHAEATRASVRVRSTDDLVVVEVEDDGKGGAHSEPGGGLEGLATRVATVDGGLSISSPAGGPTLIRAELPCAS